MTSVPTQLLRERFPVLRTGDTPGERVGECPCIHEGAAEATFPVRDLGDGTWSIQLCDLGCTPQAIWDGAEPLDRPEPGEDRPEAEAAPSWGFATAADFLAREFPLMRWLYLDLVPAEAVTVLMAAPNAGKTFFALDVVAQVAVRAAAAGATVWIVEEEGTGAALQWRLSRALASVGIDLRHEAALRIHVSWNTGRNLLDVQHLALLAAECVGAELIMLDSLSALFGGVDENSSEDMAKVANSLHSLKVNTGSAVMALHHMAKAAWKEGETPRLEHMRGHGSLPGRADAVLALVPLESDEEEVRFELHCVKQRDGSKPRPRRCSVTMKGPIANMAIEDKEAAPRVALTAKMQAIEMDVLSKIPVIAPGVSKTFLENTIHGHRAQEIRRAVDRLTASGRSVQTPSGRYIRGPKGMYASPSGRGGTESDGVTPSDPVLRRVEGRDRRDRDDAT